jgi:hypothetical protein
MRRVYHLPTHEWGTISILLRHETKLNISFSWIEERQKRRVDLYTRFESLIAALVGHTSLTNLDDFSPALTIINLSGKVE